MPCWRAWSRSTGMRDEVTAGDLLASLRSTEMRDEVTAGALLASLKQEYGNA